VVISQLKSLLLSPVLRFFRLSFLCVAIFAGKEAAAQITIRGTVYNMYRTRPLDAVSVMSSFGKGTSTDSNGHYVITLDIDDSISFSYLGRTTAKYPVKAINSITGFDIALHVNPTELNEVRVAPRNYHMDSLANRREYERVFNYRKPGISLTSPSQGLGVGLDLDELINMFRFQRNRRLQAFQRRLLDEEEDKFIEHRFSRSLVKKITDLNEDQIDSFMVKYKPSYAFTKASTDYEFYDYIKLASEQYKKDLINRSDMLGPRPRQPKPL
jgi:hypothetical protein